MLVYSNTVYDYVTAWIRTLAESKAKKTLLCVITGGIDSCLNAALCLRSTSHIPVNLVFIGYKPEIEKAFEEYVINNYPNTRYKIIKPVHPTFSDPALENIDARASLIATYVDMYSKLYDSMTFGSITKSEYSMIKLFKSRIDEIYDYYPIIDLYRSEIIQLAKFINMPEVIINATSGTEASFGYTYEELEWLDRENNSINIVSASDFPNFAPHWGLFNARKKALVMKVYQLQKDGKSKIIPENEQCLIRKALPGSIS